MANTGTVIPDTLKEVLPPCPVPCTATGEIKDNLSSDIDYIPPYTDLSKCPISFDTACPTFAATGLNDAAVFEMYVKNSVLFNPAVRGIRVEAVESAFGVQYSNDFNFPLDNINYQEVSISSLVSGSYTFNAYYYDASSTVVASCLSLATVNVI